VSNRLATAIQELRSEEQRIQAEIDELHQRAKSREAELKPIRTALAVLSDKPQRKSAKQKPAASKGEVVASIVDALKSKGPLPATELKEMVADQLLAHGKSRVGLALRFSEALADSKFVCSNDGVVSLPTKNMAG
jgi:chromosome segregation ATPase